MYASLVAQLVNNLPAMKEAPVQFLVQEDPLEGAAYPLQYSWASLAQMGKNLSATWETWFNPWVGKIPWRRAWQPTPVSSILACRIPMD